MIYRTNGEWTVTCSDADGSPLSIRVKSSKEAQKAKQKRLYDRRAKGLSTLKQGDLVKPTIPALGLNKEQADR